MEKVCSSYGFDLVDMASAINADAMGLTNMLNYDVHPNAAGHVEIARAIANHLGISLDPAENTFDVETEPETTIEETTVSVELTLPAETEPETDAQTEATGCASSVSSAMIVAVACAYVILKKKRA